MDSATYGIEGMCAVAAVHGDGWRAGALAAVAETIRESAGIYDIAGFAVHLEPLAAVRAADPASVAAGERAGREMTLADAIAIAIPDADARVAQKVPSW
jgi:hypothetical protein